MLGALGEPQAGIDDAQGNLLPELSDDGRFAIFSSRKNDLVSGDTNGNSDVFVVDRESGITTRVSTDAAGSQVPIEHREQSQVHLPL